MELPSPSNPGVGYARYCAALEGDITPPNCSALRGSNLACPPACTHYPFGASAYEKFFRLEGAWTAKAAQYILQSAGRDRFDQLIREGALLADADLTALESGLIHAVHYGIAFEKHPAGGSLVDHWALSGFLALSNDERLMTHCRRNASVTVVQVREIVDHQRVLCVDALKESLPAFCLFDRSTAVHATVGVRLLSWLTHYPHFSRLGSMAREIPDALWDPWRQAIEERFEKDHVREPKLTLRSWLSRRAGACADLLDTLSTDSKETLSSSDFHHQHNTYVLQSTPAHVLAVLRSHTDFQPASPAKINPNPRPIATFRLVRLGEPTNLSRLFQHDAPQDGIGSLGNLQLYEDRLVLETFTYTKLALANQLLLDSLSALIGPSPSPNSSA